MVGATPCGLRSKKPHTVGVFEVRNHLRHSWLRHSKFRGGFGHAPALHDREKDVQVAQPKAPANVTFPIDPLDGHRSDPRAVETNREFPYDTAGLTFSQWARTRSAIMQPRTTALASLAIAAALATIADARADTFP